MRPLFRSRPGRLWCLVSLLLLALAGCASQPPRSGWAKVHGSGVLVIGTDATYPPFENKVGDTPQGFDIDLGTEVARRLGVKVRWVNAGFDGIFPALLDGKFDAAMSAITITPARAAHVRFSDAYYDAGQVIAVRKGTPPVGPNELSGMRVGVQLNTTGQVVVEKIPGVTLKKYNTIDLALLDLSQGRLDAVVNDRPVTAYMLARAYPDLTISGPPFTREQYGIAFAPGNRELASRVDGALAAIRKDGTYQRLYDRWFGPQAATPAAKSTFWNTIGRYLLEGMSWTVQLTFWGLLWGLPLGMLVGLARTAPWQPVRWAATLYTEAIRGTPLLVQIFTIYFVLPAAGIRLPEYLAAVIALSVNSAAYIAEIFRAGIESIPVGQMEAARALGMGWPRAMGLVILPQAVRRVVPPLTNEAIALLKDSSLVSIMGMSELTRTGQELASRLADPTRVWLSIAICYLLLTIPLTGLARRLERSWGTP